MKLIIDIPEEIYKASQIVDVKYEDTIQIPLEVITNGTPITDNETECDKCVYSTKDGYCQYDDITETIPPFTVCDIEQKSCDTCIYNGVFSLECARCDDDCTKWKPTVCDIEQYKNFAKWIAGEIMPEIEWQNNQNAFPELACRRLEKLGIVKADGNKWVLI